jgi:MFS family permease
MKVAAVLFLISAIGAGLAPDLFWLVVFRIIGGAGVGVASVIAPAYIAEIAPARIRGRLGSLQQLAIVTGILISLLVDYMFALAAGGSREPYWLGLEAWRWMFIAMAVPSVVYGLLALTIPESPRYLVAKHRVPEARRILAALLGERNLDATIDRIKQTLNQEKPPSWRDLKAGPGGKIVPIVLGRKPLLIIGSAAMAVTLATMTVIFGTARIGANGVPELGDTTGMVALVAANLFVVGFGMSWGPVVWVLLGEMFPNRIRAAALSLAAAGQWVANWLITVSFPPLKDLSLGLAYGFYALCAVLSLFFVARFVQETTGRALEDMTADAPGH